MLKVSIVTVCLNSDSTIEQTIKSVISQTYPNIEHVVIDGGSTDHTVEIINRYKDNISYFISEPDNGIYDAMNKGIKAVNGSIIGFLNAGDFYSHKEVVTIVAQSIKETMADCCYANVEYIAKDNPEKTVRLWKSCTYKDGLFEKGWHPPHPSFFVKKNVLEKYGDFDLRYKIAADYELMLRLLKKDNIKSIFIDKVLTKIKVGGESNKNLWNILKANLECYKAWKNNGLKINPIIIIRKPVSKLSQYWIKR